MSSVLDASALLCVINREPGFDQVVPVLAGASISAVNWCEVIAKLVERGAGKDILDDLASRSNRSTSDRPIEPRC